MMDTSAFNVMYLFNETFDSWIMLFTTYVSIVFAFLVAATLSADKLNRTLASLAVAMFSLAALFFVVMTTIVGGNVLRILGMISELPNYGDGRAPGAVPYIMVGTVSGLMLLSFAAALFFFYIQRKRSKTASLDVS